jgi:hypothetical protein
VSKLSVWEERDKAIAAGYEKLNNEVLPEVAADKEATIGAKSAKKFWYGFKKHVGVDMRSGMINRVAVTTASVPDSVGTKHVMPQSSAPPMKERSASRTSASGIEELSKIKARSFCTPSRTIFGGCSC